MFDGFDWADPVSAALAGIAMLGATLAAIYWLLDRATRDLKKW